MLQWSEHHLDHRDGWMTLLRNEGWREGDGDRCRQMQGIDMGDGGAEGTQQ